MDAARTQPFISSGGYFIATGGIGIQYYFTYTSSSSDITHCNTLPSQTPTIPVTPTPTPTNTATQTQTPTGTQTPISYTLDTTNYNNSTTACRNGNLNPTYDVYMAPSYTVPTVGAIVYTSPSLGFYDTYNGQSQYHLMKRGSTVWAVGISSGGFITDIVVDCAAVPTDTPTPTPTVTPTQTPTHTQTPTPTSIPRYLVQNCADGSTQLIVNFNGTVTIGNVYQIYDPTCYAGFDGVNCWEVLSTSLGTPDCSVFSSGTEFTNCTDCLGYFYTADRYYSDGSCGLIGTGYTIKGYTTYSGWVCADDNYMYYITSSTSGPTYDAIITIQRSACTDNC